MRFFKIHSLTIIGVLMGAAAGFGYYYWIDATQGVALSPRDLSIALCMAH